MELAKAVLLFFDAILVTVMGLAVLLRNSRNPSNIFFFLVTLSMAGWSAGVGLFLLVDDAGLSKLLAQIFYAFPLLIAFSLLSFSLSFPAYKRHNLRLILATGLGFTVLLGLLFGQDRFLISDLYYDEGVKTVVLNHGHYAAYASYLLFCFVGTLALMFYKKSHLKGIYASQAGWFFYGFLITFFMGVIFNLFLPWFGNYSLIWIGPNCVAIFTSAIAYSIIRHKMFDIKLVVARSVAYLLLISTLAAAYAAVVFFWAARYFTQNSVFAQQVVPMLAAFFLVATAPYLKKHFDRWTNRFFYRDMYEPQVFLDQLNQILVANIQLSSLLEQVTKVIQDNVKCDVCLIGVRQAESTDFRFFGTSRKTVDMSAISPELVKMRQKIVLVDELEGTHTQLSHRLSRHGIAVVGSLSGYEMQQLATVHILLGPKKSGNVFNKQDVRMLEIISDQLNIAIQNAIRYEEIQGFAITLQRRIKAATRDLERSNEKLKALDEAKDDFISMASHQLRTPLTSVKGYLSLMTEGDAGKLTSQQRGMVDQAYFSAQRMVYIIADLLNVSRLSTGKFVIDASPVNLRAVVREEIEQLKAIAQSRSVKLDFNLPDSFPELMLDEMKTRQIIMNFVDNAIYYTPAGGQVVVSLRDLEHTIELRVKDTGIGVPKSEQAHLFTKFYRAGNARQVRPDGTGLGLYMAKKVIIAQGGALIFKSDAGKGSTFGFILSKAKLSPKKPYKITATD